MSLSCDRLLSEKNGAISGAMNLPLQRNDARHFWQIKTPLEIYQISIIYFPSILAAYFENVKKGGVREFSGKTHTTDTTRMKHMPAYTLLLLTVLLRILRKYGIILLYISLMSLRNTQTIQRYKQEDEAYLSPYERERKLENKTDRESKYVERKENHSVIIIQRLIFQVPALYS